MSRKTAFSTQARVLLCQHCGAPIEVANAGGLSPCSFCEAQNRVVLAEIDGTGKVSAATASGSLPAELNACLQKEVLASAFPPPKEGHATLSIPVTFDAR